MVKKINKLKSIYVLSNGSTHFVYKTFNNLKKYVFFEKDYINLSFNIKHLNNLNFIDKQSTSYKNKYIIKTK